MWASRLTRVLRKTFKILFNIQSNSVMTSRKGPNELCPYK